MNISGPVSGLSPRAEKIIRVLSTLTVLGLAIAAAILSFSGLQQLALRAEINPSIAWLLPVVIDGMVLTGSLGVVSSSLVGIGTWYPWLLTMTGVVASVAGNVAVAPPNLSSRLVHATGPLTFALSIEGLLRIYRASALATAQRERERVAKEEADYEKQLKKEEREARKEARLLESSQNAPILTPTPTIITPVASVSAVEKPTQNQRLTNKPGATKDKVRQLLLSEPDITGAEVAKRLNLDPSYARKTIRDIKSEALINTDNPAHSLTVSQELTESNSLTESTSSVEETPILEYSLFDEEPIQSQ